MPIPIYREYFKRLGGEMLPRYTKEGKGAKTETPHHWRSFYMATYDWLKDII